MNVDIHAPAGWYLVYGNTRAIAYPQTFASYEQAEAKAKELGIEGVVPVSSPERG